MHKKRSFYQNFILFIIGTLIGIANKTPGVSGGMILLISNVYEEYIHSLERINKHSLTLLKNWKFKEFYNYINGNFLLWVGLGSFFAFFAISALLNFFLDFYLIETLSLFFGLIAGSIYFISRKIGNWNKTIYFFLFISTLIGLLITLIKPLPENTNIFFIFLCGIVSVLGVPLPGFSGSFLVFILGNYTLLMVDAANNLMFIGSSILNWDFTFINNIYRMNLFFYGCVFSIGSFIGLISLSKLISYLLKLHHDKVIASLIGFIFGSLGAVWPWRNVIYKLDEFGNKIKNSNNEFIINTYKRFIPKINSDLVFVLFIAIIGFLIVYVIAKVEDKYFLPKPPSIKNE
ncbi:MAG: DUF368 domain-containing protein [Solirubrobacteraceae bacterium]